MVQGISVKTLRRLKSIRLIALHFNSELSRRIKNYIVIHLHRNDCIMLDQVLCKIIIQKKPPIEPGGGEHDTESNFFG